MSIISWAYDAVSSFTEIYEFLFLYTISNTNVYWYLQTLFAEEECPLRNDSLLFFIYNLSNTYVLNTICDGKSKSTEILLELIIINKLI